MHGGAGEPSSPADGCSWRVPGGERRLLGSGLGERQGREQKLPGGHAPGEVGAPHRGSCRGEGWPLNTDGPRRDAEGDELSSGGLTGWQLHPLQQGRRSPRKPPCKGPVWGQSAGGLAPRGSPCRSTRATEAPSPELAMHHTVPPAGQRRHGGGWEVTWHTHQTHSKTTAKPRQARPHRPPCRGPAAGRRLTPCTHSHVSRGWPSEAQSDTQREVNHVLFMTNDANISRMTSPQISLML